MIAKYQSEFLISFPKSCLQTKFKCLAIASENYADPIILGTDFLENNKANINFENKKINIENLEIYFEDYNTLYKYRPKKLIRKIHIIMRAKYKNQKLN